MGYPIRVSMRHFVEHMEELPLAPARKTQVKSQATDDENSFAESVIGPLGWLSRQLRMDISFGCSWL
eukprot:1166912-Pyramimonas_sp.AAC.1